MPKMSLSVGATLSVGNYQTARVDINISDIDTSKPITDQLLEVENIFPDVWKAISEKLDKGFDNLENEYGLKVGGNATKEKSR